MNNRKTTNKRGKCSRGEWAQFVSEPKTIRFYVGEGMEKQLMTAPNPKVDRIRRIIHKNQ